MQMAFQQSARRPKPHLTPSQPVRGVQFSHDLFWLGSKSPSLKEAFVSPRSYFIIVPNVIYRHSVSIFVSTDTLLPAKLLSEAKAVALNLARGCFRYDGVYVNYYRR